MTRQYNAPPGSASDIGYQMRDFHYQKEALIEAKREQYFQPLASSLAMPKNMGKKIKRYHYIPLLDDENINDQGLDAAGAVIDSNTYTVFLPGLVSTYGVEADATAAAAAINAIEGSTAAKTGASTPWTVTATKQSLLPTSTGLASAVVAAVKGSVSTQNSGNLYGSSKDIGVIPTKFPALTENGGRVNRVGFKRKEIEGTFEKFGFFDEYTQESLDFDSDADLMRHINREMIFGANEMTEDMLQIDLINNAGVIRYPGSATSIATMDTTAVTYRDLLRLHLVLNENRTPLHTKVMTGTRMVDTRTIAAGRVMYIGSELQPMFEEMVDLHSERAFIPVQKYAGGTTIMNGEIGQVSHFRLVVVPEMMKWAGGGAVSASATHYTTNGKLDVFPMLVIGDESFTTIGFQTDGKTVKFKIYHKAPGEETADRNDPYGETGFMSIKWYYGFMLLRGERLAVQYSTAEF